MNVTLLVKGLTVKRTILVTAIGVAVVVPLAVNPPPLVLVPAFSFGEPFGSSWFVTIWKLVGPFAKPLTRIR